MKIRLTERARRDLAGIAEYTERQWGTRQRNRYLAQLENRFSWLARNSQLGIHRPDIKEGYYCFPEGRHLIFFLKAESTLDIIGIPHQDMDIVGWFDTEAR